MARRQATGERRGLLGWAVDKAGIAAAKLAMGAGRVGAGIVSTVAAAIREAVARVRPGTPLSPVDVNAHARALTDSAREAVAHSLSLLGGDDYTTQLTPQIGVEPEYTYHVETDVRGIRGAGFERLYTNIVSDEPLSNDDIRAAVAADIASTRANYEAAGLADVVINTIEVLDVTRG